MIRNFLQRRKVVPGAGFVEVAAAVWLRGQYREQSSQRKEVSEVLARALLSLPRHMCCNGGWDGFRLVAELSQTLSAPSSSHYPGLDLVHGCICPDVVAAGILEQVDTKVHMIRFAVETVCGLLKIEDAIFVSKRVGKHL